MLRKIVVIDEEKCDGCGLCVPTCHEGAIAVVDGKAKLVSDRYCDGLGACLGHCPQDAIRIEEREADPFDEAAVNVRLQAPSACDTGRGHAGCPGAAFAQFAQTPSVSPHRDDAPASPSALTHWPIKLRLLPPDASVLRGARLLVAADCAAAASAEFHTRFLAGRAVVMGCPKFDDLPGYVQKLAAMMKINALKEVVVVRMEVPCCTGIARAVETARRIANVETPLTEVIINARGEVVSEHEVTL